MLLSDILQEDMAIRESFATPQPLVMTTEDCEKKKQATECHICNKSLIKDLFLYSIPVFIVVKATKFCYCVELKKMEFIGPKRETR